MRTQYRVVKYLALLSVICLVVAPLPAISASGTAWKQARPDYRWSFPADHWARPGYKTEWWYFTGQVEAEPGRRFGYQFTFFRIGVLPEKPDAASDWAVSDLIMGHAAVSDLRANRHYFSEVLYRAMPLLGGFGVYPDPKLAWSRGPAGTEGYWQLEWNGAGFDFDMRDDAQNISFAFSTRADKPLILQVDNGFSPKDVDGSAASQYYSFTRLQTTGQVSIGGETWPVTGTSWMDKEFSSNQLTDRQVGWDWFSLQLDDRREIMLYMLRHQDGTIDFARGTLIEPDGQTAYLGRSAFTVTGQASWKSPHTSAVYPSKWQITIPQAALGIEVVAEMADQENRSRLMPDMHYWEGAVKVLQDGQPIGQGYVELTGYGKASRPAL